MLCVPLRRQQDEQVPTRSPIAKSRTIQTIHNDHNNDIDRPGFPSGIIR